MDTLSETQIQSLLDWDPQGVLQMAQQAPERALRHWKQGQESPLGHCEAQHIVVCGMGGSGSTGDVFQLVCAQAEIPIYVNKAPHLPAWVGAQTLVIGVSYSGNTTETLSALAEAHQRGARLLLLSSGGKLQSWAQDIGVQYISISGGLPPRAALFDMLFALLGSVHSWPALHVKLDTEQVLQALKYLSQAWSLQADTALPLPFQLAQYLSDCFPILWGDVTQLGPLVQRWKNQLSENAKTVAGWALLPEANHNELVAMCAQHHSEWGIVYLTLEETLPALDAISVELVSEYVGKRIVVQARGASQFEKVLYLTYLADFTSIYLALLKEEDPYPIHAIDEFKRRIAEKSEDNL